jgi:SAM-dependent methyltransferase
MFLVILLFSGRKRLPDSLAFDEPYAQVEKRADGMYVIRCAVCQRTIVANAAMPEGYAQVILTHQREACPATITPGLWLFDNPETRRLTEDRMNFIVPLLRELRHTIGIDSAVDVGCGLGDFSAFLSQFGISRVVGIDGRTENLVEARKRHKDVVFQLADAEELPVEQLGSFDLVLCFGLLYHLENPLRAIRKLHALTSKVLIIESVCVPGAKPKLELLDEAEVQNQGLNHLGFYPSEPCLVKMLSRAGFPFVYQFLELPDNTLYAETAQRKRMRTMMVASRSQLYGPNLRLVQDQLRMSTEHADPWAKPARGVRSRLGQGYRALKARLGRRLT